MSHQVAKFTELSVELQHLYQMHCLHFPHLTKLTGQQNAYG